MSYESQIFSSLLNHTARISRPVYSSILSGTLASPYLYYPFDWNVKDYSGNSRDGVLGYDTSQGTGSGPVIAPGGKSVNSLEFIGADYSLVYRLNTGVVSFAAAYSISIWVYPTTWETIFYTEFDPNNAGDYNGFHLGTDATGHVTGLIVNEQPANDTILSFTSTSTLTLSAWNHVVFCSNASGNAAKLYINGALDATNVTYSHVGMTFPSDRILGIGGGYPIGGQEAHFTGFIDEVSLFQSQISAGNVTTIYTGTPAVDNYGRPTATSYYHQNAVAAHFSDHRLPGGITSGKEGLIFQVEYTKQQPICVLPFTADVAVLDVVKNEGTGVEYEVESVEDSAGQGQHKRVFLKRFE